MPSLGELHIGDIGTRYLCRVWDAGVPFDPSEATLKQLRFRMPGGIVIARDADEVVTNGSPATEWYLAYTVTAYDVAGSPLGDFHGTRGPLKIQAVLEFVDGTVFHSTIETVDEDNRRLHIYSNLSVT